MLSHNPFRCWKKAHSINVLNDNLTKLLYHFENSVAAWYFSTKNTFPESFTKKMKTKICILQSHLFHKTELFFVSHYVT